MGKVRGGWVGKWVKWGGVDELVSGWVGKWPAGSGSVPTTHWVSHTHRFSYKKSLTTMMRIPVERGKSSYSDSSSTLLWGDLSTRSGQLASDQLASVQHSPNFWCTLSSLTTHSTRIPSNLTSIQLSCFTKNCWGKHILLSHSQTIWVERIWWTTDGS